MRLSIWRGVMVGGALLAMAPAAGAQAPPEVAEIAACLCLHRAIDARSAGMTERQHAYDQVQSELAALDSELARERAAMNVDDPQSVARFRQLLARRDALFHRSTGPLAADLSAAVGGYNASVSEYNARCANQPRDPDLLARVQATLSCPAP
jgi:hypothetical protein